MKHDPEDIRSFADDIAQAIGNHPDAMSTHPELQQEARKLRDLAYSEYCKIMEHAHRTAPS